MLNRSSHPFLDEEKLDQNLNRSFREMISAPKGSKMHGYHLIMLTRRHVVSIEGKECLISIDLHFQKEGKYHFYNHLLHS